MLKKDTFMRQYNANIQESSKLYQWLSYRWRVFLVSSKLTEMLAFIFIRLHPVKETSVLDAILMNAV